MSTLQISIRDLHNRTGHFVRKASSLPIVITDNGKPIAEIKAFELKKAATGQAAGKSYWAKRKLLPGFKQLMKNGVLRPKPGQKTMDEILDEVKADSVA